MKNVILISADFPYTYWQFARAFKDNGANVFVIGGTPYHELTDQLKRSITRYYHCWDMQNIEWMKEIVGCIINEFGPIDYLESNNEFWLRNDSILREHFGIEGLKPAQLDEYQKKSSMKKFFEEGGAKVAPYLLVTDKNSVLEFANKFGYPLFAKPDIGVGAGGNFKIKNEADLDSFFAEKDPNTPYICEVFVNSHMICTFDGITNNKSEAVICDSMVCPPSIFEIKQNSEDMCYFVMDRVDPKLEKVGKKTIKVMGLKNRIFHAEFFIAAEDCPGYFKKGDYVGIEVNIRAPGGYTPDMIDFALSTSVYDILADVVCFGTTDLTYGERFYCVTSSRRYHHSYFYNDEDIFRTYRNNICFSGDYPSILSDIMGDKFYMAKFKSFEDVKLFDSYITKRCDIPQKSSTLIHPLLGEDARMMREKKY